MPGQKYDQYLKRYELLVEFKHMKNPNNCPPGIYLRPEPENLNEWHGVLFIHRGYYKEGVFKFVIEIPKAYPNAGPSVLFLTDMFHPLIGRDGRFSLSQQFPVWRPRKDYIAHILHYLKNSFRESVLSSLQEEACSNKEAYKIFHNERGLYAKLAAQCAQLSVSEGVLFDHSDTSAVKFSPLTEDHFEEIKLQMMNSGVSSM
ncbi:ubiquitin-conjugating enzyme/RWD-like protein [Fimicolochytrium jonesii]|uniref:ubiquitin-conjugating enzyme/RWD-like protein n=1 Tax=Fimicolochytrium jonesii TaxID=1396493 RepID=UPI0022FE3F27|nr:ubiquitin-conjugating enzyme/RWD-like protein [Fimicolochytrium jonesii]KAI8817197.1 ubiquitin-conjugating enzyme/RWD-like protein [Fimicolochytrium jonesii]